MTTEQPNRIVVICPHGKPSGDALAVASWEMAADGRWGGAPFYGRLPNDPALPFEPAVQAVGPNDASVDVQALGTPGVRRRFVIYCETCEVEIPARADKLYRCLDLLHEQGESWATVDTIRRMLTLV